MQKEANFVYQTIVDRMKILADEQLIQYPKNIEINTV